jgi:hypothetical protein
VTVDEFGRSVGPPFFGHVRVGPKSYRQYPTSHDKLSSGPAR